MPRPFLPLAALVLAAFTSIAPANDVEPKPGHYESSGKIDRNHVEFDLLRNGDIRNLKIAGRTVKIHDVEVNGRDKFHFSKSSAMDGRRHAGEYLGHGKWETDRICRGDFRYYPPLTNHDDENEYHVWQARWVSK